MSTVSFFTSPIPLTIKRWFSKELHVSLGKCSNAPPSPIIHVKFCFFEKSWIKSLTVVISGLPAFELA